MTMWITETEYRRSGGVFRTGLAINTAFLEEIKEDSVEFRQVLKDTSDRFSAGEMPTPVDAARLLGNLRDALQTYFAVEAFYGYFENAEIKHQAVSNRAQELLDEHDVLFLQLNGLVDEAQQIVYKECSDELTVREIAGRFDEFCQALQAHEDAEMNLVMRLHNEDIGVGD
ncbi:MAG: hypothetical protein AAF456_12185 [Planctomycetota bacterium]